MALLFRRDAARIQVLHLARGINTKLYPQKERTLNEEGFPLLKLLPSKEHKFGAKKSREFKQRYQFKRREESMKEDQDWPSIWQAAKTFSPSAVPLPIRQSYEENDKPARGKYCNTELLKIPNFLHLTPGAIERHCKAIKKFCTQWPEGLDSDERVREHFPVTYVTQDYVHSSPTIRDHRARVVQLKIDIQDLKLNETDKDKLIRLAGHRYDKETGMITITTDSCPVRIQNQDYAQYLVTALYYESLKHEKWEIEKPEIDWERFYWNKSQSKSKIKTYLSPRNPQVKDEIIETGQGDRLVEDYKQSLEKIFENENVENLESYRLSVEKLLGIGKQDEMR